MIAGIFHLGAGIGNQLFRYCATRILALDKGYDFTMVAPELFKGKDFMNLQMSSKELNLENTIPWDLEQKTGKIIPKHSIIIPKSFDYSLWNEWDKQVYDPDFNFIEDNTIIDGNFEDERYFGHRLPKINEWLKVEPLEIPDDVCVIGFRGGEYYTVPELGLPKEYFKEAEVLMLQKNINMKFEVHTDDPELAKQFFPNYKIIRDIGINWRAMRYAKYAIIANSSFYVLPRLLRHIGYTNWDMEFVSSNALTIAPRYWNRYNTKKWEFPQGYYKSFKYI